MCLLRFSCLTYVLCICTFLYSQLLWQAIFIQFLWRFIAPFTFSLSPSCCLFLSRFYSFLLVNNQNAVMASTQFLLQLQMWKNCCNFFIPCRSVYFRIWQIICNFVKAQIVSQVGETREFRALPRSMLRFYSMRFRCINIELILSVSCVPLKLRQPNFS